MKNQKVSTGLGAIVLVIIAITVGVISWKIVKDKETTEEPQEITVQAKPVEKKQVQQNQTQTQVQTDNVPKPTIITKINDDRKTWKTFQDNSSGIKLSYPFELSLNASRKDIIIGIYSISPADAYYKVPDAMIMNQLIIYSDKKNIDEIIKNQKTSNPENFTQKAITINNVSAEQISYKDAYSGGLWINKLIKRGANTIIISYPGNNQENVDLFEKIISTIQL
jgi:flagellar biosynthesis component FlhA